MPALRSPLSKQKLIIRKTTTSHCFRGEKVMIRVAHKNYNKFIN